VAWSADAGITLSEVFGHAAPITSVWRLRRGVYRCTDSSKGDRTEP